MLAQLDGIARGLSAGGAKIPSLAPETPPEATLWPPSATAMQVGSWAQSRCGRRKE